MQNHYSQTNINTIHFLGAENASEHAEITKRYMRLVSSVSSSLQASISFLSGYTTSEKSVILCLCAHQGKNEYSFASMELMSIETGLNKRTIEKAIKKLQNNGLLTSRIGYLNNGFKVTQRYFAKDALLCAFANANSSGKRIKNEASSVTYMSNMNVSQTASKGEYSASEMRLNDHRNASESPQKSGEMTAKMRRNDRTSLQDNINIYNNINIRREIKEENINTTPYPQKHTYEQAEEGKSHFSFSSNTKKKELLPTTADEVYEFLKSQGFTSIKKAQAQNWFYQKRKENWTFNGNPIDNWKSLALAYCRKVLKLTEELSDISSKAKQEENSQIISQPPQPQKTWRESILELKAKMDNQPPQPEIQKSTIVPWFLLHRDEYFAKKQQES